LSITSWYVRNSVEPVAIRQVHNERIKTWPLLGFEDSGDCPGVKRVSGESVHGFGGECDYVPFPKQINRRNSVG
jgi:hypothetical protein